jgi:transposase InsO family protein
MCAAQWIDLEEAARRSGRRVGHLKRVAARLADEGKARKERSESGQLRWLVAEDADPKFSRVKFSDQIGTDLGGVPANKREQAIARRAILKALSGHRSASLAIGFDKLRATHHFCEQLLIGVGGQWDDLRATLARAGQRGGRLSIRTLYNWEDAFSRQGLRGLVDGRGGKEKEKAADPFVNRIKELWLNARQPKLSRCYVLAEHEARERGWTICSKKTAQRFVNAIPAAVVYKVRGGPDVYVAKAEPFIERDYSTVASNEIWCGDHHQFDVLVKVSERVDGASGEVVTRHVRPWMTCWQDVRSRKIVAWEVFGHDPNSDTVLSTLRAGVLAHGVPQKLYIDNGKDYDCYDFNGRTKRDRWQKRRFRVSVENEERAGIFAALEIETIHAMPYHGQSKLVERFFGTFEQDMFVWDTYCGNSPQAKPHDLQLQVERGKAPTLDDFASWADAWVHKYNTTHRHAGNGMDGQTPDAVYRQALPASIRTASAELLDLLLMRRVGPLKVGRNGITYKGLRYGQYQLGHWLDREVYIRVESVARVQVYTADDKFVCLADCNQAVPANATPQMLRQAIASKRTDSKLRSTYHHRRPRLAEDLPERMVRISAEQAAIAAADDPDQPPPALKPIRSPLEASLPALRAALDTHVQRIAVGAESLSFGQLGERLQPEPDAPANSPSPMSLLRGAFDGGDDQ